MADLEAQKPSYWTSVLIAGVAVGVIVFIVSIILGYVQINSEPSGSMFSGMSLSGLVPCLMAAFAGMLAIWHYTSEVEKEMKLGRGALIGLMTGIVVILAQTILSKLWILIDPDYMTAIRDHMIQNYEMMSLPEAQKQTIIDGLYQEFQNQNSFFGILKQLAYGAIGYGILNVITGMIGVKIFADQPEETL
jgi:hypothetical protein